MASGIDGHCLWITFPPRAADWDYVICQVVGLLYKEDGQLAFFSQVLCNRVKYNGNSHCPLIDRLMISVKVTWQKITPIITFPRGLKIYLGMQEEASSLPWSSFIDALIQLVGDWSHGQRQRIDSQVIFWHCMERTLYDGSSIITVIVHRWKVVLLFNSCWCSSHH